jgi:hypothetical protein
MTRPLDWEDFEDRLIPSKRLDELEEALLAFEVEEPLDHVDKFPCVHCGVAFDFEDELEDHECGDPLWFPGFHEVEDV